MALGLTKETSTLMSAVSVGTESTSWGTALNGGSGERYGHMVFQVSLTFNASATGSGIVHLRKSADDGTTDNNLGTGILEIVAPASTTPQVVTVEAYGGDFIEIGVENEDSTYTITATVKHDSVKITGMS